MSYPRHEKTTAIRQMLMAMTPVKLIELELNVHHERIQKQVRELQLKRIYLTAEEEILIKNNRKKLLQAGHKW
jgi:hypothetical protein